MVEAGHTHPHLLPQKPINSTTQYLSQHHHLPNHQRVLDVHAATEEKLRNRLEVGRT